VAKNCKHEGCHCEVPSSRTDEHCSDHCKQHSTLATHAKGDCACGHVDCRPAGRVSPAGAKNENV
jgi:hypothetical protein